MAVSVPTGVDSSAVSNTATLSAESGRATGSAAARRLRAEDRIPGVLYGHGMQPLSLSVARRDLRVALSGPAGQNTILTINVDGSSYSAIVKEMQRHPVRRTVSHIDFVQINLSEEITMHVPVHLTGTAKAVLAAGGLVDPAVDTIEVRTTPANVPNEILIDVTDLTPDSVIRLGDIALPSGVAALGDSDMPVVTVLISRAGVETAAAAEGAAQAPAGESSN
jgi:large subunit ribosomal protein L25